MNDLSTRAAAEIELQLGGVAHGGEAVGRVGDLVAFVSYGFPGERVRAKVIERRPRFLRARTTEILDAVPERVTPPCPIFGTCGGCHWQHATDQAQLAFKTGVLREQLVRAGKFAEPPVGHAIASPLEWHYRNHVQMIPGLASQFNGEPARLLCFQQGHSHDVVNVEHCYISDPLINAAIEQGPWHELSERIWRRLDHVVLRCVPGGALQISLTAAEPLPAGQFERFSERAIEALPSLSGVLAAASRGGQIVRRWGQDALTYELEGHRYEVPGSAFFPVNVGAAASLLKAVVAWLDPQPTDTVLDAYAGVGTFSLPLARRAGSVIAVESHPLGAAAAGANAAANGLTNVLVRAQDVAFTLPALKPPVDLAVVDPPRRGCDPALVRALLRLRPRRIAYVSCEPSTLARDLRLLADGGYRLVASNVVDVFPQTYHVESVSLLEAS